MTETIQKRKQDIEKAIINGKLFSKITDNNTHYNRHVHMTSTDYMERILNDKYMNSIFNKESDPEFLIEESIMYKSTDIAQWLDCSKHGERQEFCVHLPEEDYGNVGHGLISNPKTNLIKEYDTNNIRIILQKDNNTPLGFTLITAYPDMTTDNVKETQRDLQTLIKQTDTYKNADIVGKAYLLHRTDPSNNIGVSYKPGNHPSDSLLYMHVPTANPNTKHLIRINEDKTALKTVTRDVITNTNSDIPTKYTQIRDNSSPQRTYNHLTVSLDNPKIKTEFEKDYPTATGELSKIQKSIQDMVTEQIQARHKERVLLAEEKEPSQQPDTTDKKQFN